ncbi:MAG: PAS domain-containing protein, partial [Rhodocyclaceae bacterium]|nr:PAS domain-containing protein [Rhodocyclaceae bacterium]
QTALRGDAAGGRPAFVLMAPVFADAERNTAVGMVSVEVMAAEFVEALFVGGARTLSLQLFDGDGSGPGAATRLAVRGVDEPTARFSARRRLAFGGHAWHFEVRSTPAYEAGIAWWKADLAIVGGFAISLLVMALVSQLSAWRARAARLADTMTRALRERDERLQLALASADEGWWDWDAAAGAMHASERACEVFGVANSTVPGELLALWRSRIHAQDREAVEAQLRRHVRHDVPFDAVYRVVLPAGVTRWVRTRGKARRDARGKLIGFSGFVCDVTERQLAEQAQAQLAARHASALAAMPDLLFELDDEGRYVRYHAANEGDLAVPPVDFLGKRSAEVLPAEVAARIDSACAQVRRAGGVAVVEYALDTRDEAAQTFEGRVVRIATGGYLWIVRNISARKAAERELLRHRDNLAELVAEQTIDLMLAKEAAERANRSRADFLATLSHELRTPLHAVLGFVDMGLASGVSEDKRTHCFERIELSGKRLLRMVSEVLDVARIEAAQGKMRLTPVDWGVVCRDVMAECEPLLRAKQMAVSVDVSDTLCPVRADGPRLQQVVMNLVTNAIKFSPVGGRVVMRLRDCHSNPDLCGDQVCLEVEDQGIGLPEDGHERIFEAFVRGDATPASVPGSGLGLSICRQYVETFGGRISAHDVPGGGALFRVLLPCATVAVTTEASAT